jgi:hypothetical protein
MSEKKYIIANIKIPIEISETNNFEPLNDYMSITFENIDELPEKSNTDYNNDFIKQKINELLGSSTPNNNDSNLKTNNIVITIDELKNRTKSSSKKNVTFRNKKSSNSQYTRKEY